ncbi:Ribosomal large subunit pseudouridine synthase D [BD1-7 clade bacterium]|uniref:Pseudouridine synthase n=1 Tax=BD1-7 clade bacterium TaxID=2029982 RepID=A0A5S9QVT8_9GAMM|nr:Ribosomal large subunit pseudouridine synthase D [BD1-7 clade bacterium]
MPTQEHIHLTAVVSEEHDLERFDVATSHAFPDYSRSRLQQWIKSGEITLDGAKARPKDKVYEGQEIVLDVTIEIEEEADKAQPIDLDIVHEDDSLIVINKPVGLVVHPAAGHSHSTLMNGLLYHAPELANIPRAGIVHRLDKDTSGLMVVAKTLPAHHSLVGQLQERSVSRQYYAIVQGVMTAGGTVEEPIGRHPRDRQKQAVVPFGGKEAITHYRVVDRFRAHTLVRCQLETGRTHQIRVHMAHIRYPLLGDKTYAGRPKIPKASSPEFTQALQRFPRQALHAFRLGLNHPEDGEYCEWEIDLPDDMQALLGAMASDQREHS